MLFNNTENFSKRFNNHRSFNNFQSKTNKAEEYHNIYRPENRSNNKRETMLPQIGMFKEVPMTNNGQFNTMQVQKTYQDNSLMKMAKRNKVIKTIPVAANQKIAQEFRIPQETNNFNNTEANNSGFKTNFQPSLEKDQLENIQMIKFKKDQNEMANVFKVPKVNENLTGFSQNLKNQKKSLYKKLEQAQNQIQNLLDENKRNNYQLTPNKIIKKKDEQNQFFNNIYENKEPVENQQQTIYQKFGNTQHVQQYDRQKSENDFHMPGVQQGKMLENFLLGDKIGKGAYAIVRIATDVNNNQTVAVKIYDKTKLYGQKKRNVFNEIQILNKIRNVNCIQMIKSIEDSKTINLIMEYPGTKSLADLYKKYQKKIPFSLASSLTKQLVDGFAYLHNMNIVHRDIKLENILLKDNCQIKIIDFGFSVFSKKNQKLNLVCGTPNYMAPELLNKQEYTGFEVDIWALGVLIYQLIYGTYPFKGFDEKQLYLNIKKGVYHLDQDPEKYQVNQLIKNMLQLNPSRRITSENACSLFF